MTSGAARRRVAAFLDKDGTLVDDVPYNVDPARVTYTPHAFEALRRLDARGFALVIITNQPGLALGRFDAPALDRLAQAIGRRFAEEGLHLAGFFACPHAPAPDGSPACACRKPAPGLLHQAADALHLDLSASWMVGDILNDVEAGHRAGCRSAFLVVGNETVWHLTPERRADVHATDLLDAARQILAAPAPALAARAPEGALP